MKQSLHDKCFHDATSMKSPKELTDAGSGLIGGGRGRPIAGGTEDVAFVSAVRVRAFRAFHGAVVDPVRALVDV